MKEYGEIFTRIEETLRTESYLSEREFENRVKKFENLDYKDMSDGDVFWIMVKVVFYSGFKAETVRRRLQRIRKYLYDFKKVKNFSEEEINRFLKDPGVIRRKDKVKACINNAKEFDMLLKKYGSFQDYIESFDTPAEKISIGRLRSDLRSKFDYLGKRTVYHFLMDLGLNVIKPDRVVCRIFDRLGLIESKNNISQAIEVGKKMASVTGHQIRYIDIILAKYGQVESRDFGLERGICLEKNPRCHICRAEKYCSYSS